MPTFPWLNFNRIIWRKGNAPDEGGIDISEPKGEPITSLTGGTIVGSGYYWGHGVVTVRTPVPKLGLADLYYQHIQIAKGIKTGQQVHIGQTLGHANWGLVEVGLNPPWYGPWGPKPHPSAWVDPEDILRILAEHGQHAPVTHPVQQKEKQPHGQAVQVAAHKTGTKQATEGARSGSTRAFSVAKHRGSYTVRGGDTLASVASRIGITIDALWNDNRATISAASAKHGGPYWDKGHASNVPGGVRLYSGTVLHY